MKIVRSATILTVRETPGCMWVFGMFFAIVGLIFVYGASGGYSNFSEMSAAIMVFHFLGGAAAVAAGVWVIFISPKTTVTIDRNTEQVTLERRGLSGKMHRSFAFDEIREFSLLQESDQDGDPAWSLRFETVGGEEIRVTSVASPFRNANQDITFEINRFMYKMVPSYQGRGLLEDEVRWPIE